MFTILRKHKYLLINLAVFCIFSLCAVQFCEEIQIVKEKIYYTLHPVPVPGATDDSITLYPTNVRGDEWFVDAPIIYHAGGEIYGSSYTNSLEAVEETLSEGNFFIEIDLRYTSDGHLVCAHSWPDVYLENYEPTLEEFLSSKIQGRFTPMTADMLIQIMEQNPRMHLVLDVKDAELTAVIEDMVALAENDPAVLDRFIIQLYTGREKPSVLDIYPFKDEQFLFTIYDWGVWQLEVAQICNEENVSVITVPYGQMSDEDAALMQELGFTIYEHTINRADSARETLARGISGIYTDTLFPEDLLS